MNTPDLNPHHPAAFADPTQEHVLYHVLHPSGEDQDQWTGDYNIALDFFEQFVRDYGQAHLHVEYVGAGQCAAECLLRTDAEAAA